MENFNKYENIFSKNKENFPYHLSQIFVLWNASKSLNLYSSFLSFVYTIANPFKKLIARVDLFHWQQFEKKSSVRIRT